MIGGFSGHNSLVEAAALSKESATAPDDGAQEGNGRQKRATPEGTRGRGERYVEAGWGGGRGWKPSWGVLGALLEDLRVLLRDLGGVVG